MKYEKRQKQGYTEYHQEYGPLIGTANGKVIEMDGCIFRDLADTGKLLPYEDWRLPAGERAKDLAGRLSIEEIAGLMLYSSHQMVPGRPDGPFTGHYHGTGREEAGVPAWELTDEQKAFLSGDHVRHVLLAMVESVDTSARWSNEMQKEAERLPWGIPVNISSDPRHGAGNAGAEFKSTGSGVSVWPEGIGMAATHSVETAAKFAETAAAEYRAMGITTALWPQIDTATEPRWMRLEDTWGPDTETNIRLSKVYCDGLQTTKETETSGKVWDFEHARPDDGHGCWGCGSVIAMAKHWPGAGPMEAGRDAHYPYGKFAVYPGGRFKEHMRVFTEGAFKLDGPTGAAGAVMPYYSVSWGVDSRNGENVGNSYSEYLIRDLLRGEAGYDGVVCTDWGITGDPDPQIDSFGSRCYGTENLTVAERHLRIIMNGVDQFGGNNEAGPIIEAYRIGCDRYGHNIMDNRMRESAARLLRGMFRTGLFDNPYVDSQESAAIVGSAGYRSMGQLAQQQSVVLLKNAGSVLPLQKGIRVYVPQRTIAERKSFFRTMMPERNFMPLTQEMLGDTAVLVSSIQDADAALVFMESPLTDPYSSEDVRNGGNGYLPISLQYRPYTAENARKVSIAGGDFRENFTNRSYAGKTGIAANESDLDHLLAVRAAMPEKPVIVIMRMHNPAVMSEVEPAASAILAEFGVQIPVLIKVLFGEAQPGGELPCTLPANMETVEQHCEDNGDDMEAYVDSMGNCYGRGFRLMPR
ncbi:MAG: glycoside hydrolase family 3 C-terminal domain-containing protein [Butyrivibrio sp.]|jgi:beta-glucosidase|nr:glycoside hydrolase family 3 C-terminal domain-containing protein [Butyrivibrio sp.]